MSPQSPHSVLAADRNPLWGIVLASLCCAGWVVCWRLFAGWEQIPHPFAWWDIALVSAMCWTPVGQVLADVLLGKSRWLWGSVALGGLIASACLAEPVSSSMNPSLSRLIFGAIAGILAAMLVQSFHRSSETKPSASWSLMLLVPLAAIVTSAYAAERIRYHEKKLGEHLSQYRLMEARRWAAGLMVLDPYRLIEKKPVSLVAEDLDEELNAIRREVAHIRNRLKNDESLPNPIDVRIGLARNLAILGQMDEATDELTRLTAKNPQPRVFNLLGTMWEHQEEWDKSLKFYGQARDLLLERSSSPEQQAELVAAWKGIAYAQRKRGHYREAEAAYEELLKLAPTAAHHFLLAQFYEDAQQGDRAQFHAYKAAELNPRAFREPADQLVNSMLGEQFGCWSIFQNRRR